MLKRKNVFIGIFFFFFLATERLRIFVIVNVPIDKYRRTSDKQTHKLIVAININRTLSVLNRKTKSASINWKQNLLRIETVSLNFVAMSETVDDVLKPLFCFKFLGVVPINLRRSSRSSVFAKASFNIWYTLIFTIFSLQTVMTAHFLVRNQTSNSTKELTTVSIKILKLIVTCRCIMISFMRRKEMVAFFNWVATFDKKLRQLGICVTYRTVKKIVVAKISCLISIFIISNILCLALTRDINRCVLHLSVYNVTYFVYSLILLEFCVSTLFLRQRLTIINCSVTNVVLEGKYTKIRNERMYIPIIYNNSKPQYTLKTLGILHGEVCNAAKLINKTYSKQLLLTISRTAIELLNGIHSLINGQKQILITYDLFWSSLALLEIIFVIILSTSTMAMVSTRKKHRNLLKVQIFRQNEQLKY